MNANELADELTKMFRGEEYDRLVHEIPDMLRQQQERIKQLEETQEYLYKTHDADKAQIEALKRPNNVVGVPADKLAEMQAEIEKLRSWVEMLVEVPFFNEIDHYRGIPVAILRKASEK